MGVGITHHQADINEGNDVDSMHLEDQQRLCTVSKTSCKSQSNLIRLKLI